MSDLVTAAIRTVFLTLLWLFTGILADVIHKDVFGRKVSASDLPANEQRPIRRDKVNFQPTRFAITQGAQQGLSVPLGPTINLGHTSDFAFLLDDDYTSARHAQLTQYDLKTWMATDLGSTNGTYLNDKRITEPTPMRVNDILRIDHTMMKLGV